jgi:hypothetical protein
VSTHGRKLIKDLIDRARRQSWTVARTKGHHWLFLSPDRNVAPVVVAGTPGRGRSTANTLADLKRAGLKL